MPWWDAILRFFRIKPAHVSAEEIRETPIPVAASKSRDLKNAIELIKKFEGFSARAYLDPVGIPTIGWGHTKGVRLGDVITPEAGERLLMDDVMNERLPAVERLVSVPLTNNEVCALISFVYNVGVGAFERSTLLRLLNQGQPRAVVADQFDRWNKAKGQVFRGLVRRRAEEKRLFLTPDLVPFRLT